MKKIFCSLIGLFIVPTILSAQSLPTLPPSEVSFLQNCSLLEQKLQKWCEIREQRYREIQKYHQDHREGSKSLLVNANGGGQVPYILFRLFPELFPQIWGGNERPFDRIGLSLNDFYEQKNLLPLGIASGPTTVQLAAWLGEKRTLNKVTFSCVACHSGEVTKQDGQVLKVIGAPSTRINNLWFAFARTAELPEFNSLNFRQAIKSKPAGWFYQNALLAETESNELKWLTSPFALEEIVTQFKLKAKAQLTAFNYLATYNYTFNSYAQDPLESRRGSLDGLIPTLLAFIGDNLLRIDRQWQGLPRAVAEVDPSSIWMQKNKGYKHWDGTQGVDLHRNAGAAAANLNSPVDIENVSKITQFVENLPAEPYPFDVDYLKAQKGQAHFVQNCIHCHSGPNKVIDFKSIGTDPNRVAHFPPLIAEFQGKILQRNCADARFCNKPDGAQYQPQELSLMALGYVGSSLEGIWARAPYLHNGSVPTLRALLTNQRPEKFYRGNTRYDEKNVGFAWDYPTLQSVLFNTNESGKSNRGHNSIETLGRDWGKNPIELDELLEYLKTL